MAYSLILSLFFIVKLNIPIGINAAQTDLRSGYFNVIQKDKDLPNNSLNIIKSFQSDQSRCLLACNVNILCNIVIYNSNGSCTLCKNKALIELIDSDVGQETTVFKCQLSNIINGLINYWPIVNDLRDYMGSADMTTGPLDTGETIGFTQDRFKNSNAAIYMNPGYYIIPPGNYFGYSFSFLVWVKVLTFNSWSRIIDFGNGPYNDNFIISLTHSSSQIPYVDVFLGSTSHTTLFGAYAPKNTWFHLAVVYDSQNLLLYLNGKLVINSNSVGPKIIYRTQCFIGRSNFHVVNGDPDVSACFDDLMLYNRALTHAEVINCMDVNFN